MKRFILKVGLPLEGEEEITIHEFINGKYFQIASMPLSKAVMKANDGLFDIHAGVADKIREISLTINAMAA